MGMESSRDASPGLRGRGASPAPVAGVARAVGEAVDSAMAAARADGCVGVIGVGHDVVDLAAFGEQLREPGSRMRGLFSARELRQSTLRAAAKHDGEAVHLAARWAGKEAVLKAWCDALGDRPYPYTLDDFPWSGIEILDDSRGRPHVVPAAPVAARLAESLPGSGACDGPRWHVSLSHDGPVACAVALLMGRPA